jgi:hypothetical protein
MKYALITPTYRPDHARAVSLCQSADKFLDPAFEHVLIVPKRDMELFAPLASARRRIVTVESILPWWIFRSPVGKKWWISLRTLPIRGWILQQIVKLSAPLVTQADVLVFADSDVTFVRPLKPEHVVRDGKVRLHRMPGGGTKETHKRWHRVATQLLGQPSSDYLGSDYIGQLVCWHRDHVLGLHKKLESVGGRDWRAVLGSTLHFSEYILYGAYVEFSLGADRKHYFDDQDICHCSWHHTVADRASLDTFLKKIEPQHVAVLVQSNLGLDGGQMAKVVTETTAPIIQAQDASRAGATTP